MADALRLAARGLYTAHPNPRVGCVIVRDGEVVGRGAHLQTGGPHAEVHALTEAGERARGADVYVTLEPCAHHGRTPPCAQALIEAGVARVVAAMPDPNPQVAGQGLESLRAAGVATDVGLMRAQARELNAGFVSRMEHARPWVRLKLAASLDGRTAMASGESRWISGEASRTDVQRLRARSGAVLTGIGTLLADDPSLNLRLDQAALGAPATPAQPLRVILDSALRTPPKARTLTLPGTTLIVGAAPLPEALAGPLRAAGAEVMGLEAGADGLDLEAVLRELARREVNEVQVEAGARLSGALLAAGLVDELVLYLAPHIMGADARGLFALPGLERMADRLALQIEDLRMLGSDLRLIARPSKPVTAPVAAPTATH
jgi:diaminohydroxyphosphoribosylaminopyrimidine deaminase/5-amino-6-(5-phosphoribosylamino)uracil reductase